MKEVIQVVCMLFALIVRSAGGSLCACDKIQQHFKLWNWSCLAKPVGWKLVHWEAEGSAAVFGGLGQTQWLNSFPNIISSEIITRLDYLNVFLFEMVVMLRVDFHYL